MLSSNTLQAISGLTKWKSDHQVASQWKPEEHRPASLMSIVKRLLLVIVSIPGSLGFLLSIQFFTGLYDRDEVLRMVPGGVSSDILFGFLINTLKLDPKHILALASFGHIWFMIFFASFMMLIMKESAKESKAASQGTYNLSKETVERVSSIFESPTTATGDDYYFLARCYESGSGVIKDIEKALSVYSIAAEMKHTKAAYKVARMLKVGAGCKIDMDNYYQWLKYAEQIGSYDAAKDLAEIQTPETKNSSGVGAFAVGLAFGVIIS
ncbi:tetratricopeptide repeat protein [Vibrio harveyi]|uniref:tetratricopeptide repeat protein n=1 Tax=Vibrio harveyi TaxID=669 RepID=UPI003CF8FF16